MTNQRPVSRSRDRSRPIRGCCYNSRISENTEKQRRCSCKRNLVWKLLLNIVKPKSSPKSKSQFQVPNPSPKSKIQSPNEKEWDWGCWLLIFLMIWTQTVQADNSQHMVMNLPHPLMLLWYRKKSMVISIQTVHADIIQHMVLNLPSANQRSSSLQWEASIVSWCS